MQSKPAPAAPDVANDALRAGIETFEQLSRLQLASITAAWQWQAQWARAWVVATPWIPPWMVWHNGEEQLA